MKQAEFRFYAELNDFLPAELRGRSFTVNFEGRQSVKHLIEALGAPHTEVDLILVNGCSADFTRIVEHGDRISVYPVFEAFDIAPLSRVRPEPLRRPRFAADAHLGRLAAYLRMAGFDTFYQPQLDDEQLARLAASERRIVLTRDRDLLKRRAVTHGLYLRESNPRAQLKEVVERFHLERRLAPFTRCLRCNGLLEPISKEEAADAVPPRSWEAADEFRRCRHCRHIYWNGSHLRRMRNLLAQLIGSLQDGVH